MRWNDLFKFFYAILLILLVWIIRWIQFTTVEHILLK